jgi:hypothetical protein
MTNTTAIEFECDETGYRFWEVVANEHVEACINFNADLGYSLSDMDEVAEGWQGRLWTPPEGEKLTGPLNPTSGPGWCFTYARGEDRDAA